MILSNRNGLKNTRNMLRVFGGLNETYSCTEAEYSAGINFSARNFPALSTRLPRRKLREEADLNGMYHLNGLLTVCGRDLVYTPDDTDEMEVTLKDAVENGRKTLVGIGTKILIFPDKLAFDTASRKVSALGAVWSGKNTSVEFAPCDAEGKVYEVSGCGPAEPDKPTDGQLFLRVEDPEKPWSSESTLEVYSEASGNWSAVVLDYCRISAKGGGNRLCGRGHCDPHRLCSRTGRAVERAGRRPHRLRRWRRCSARQGRPGRRVVLWPSDPHRRSGKMGESGRQRQPGVRLGRGGGAGTPGAGHGLPDRVRQPGVGMLQQGERHLRLQAG